MLCGFGLSEPVLAAGALEGARLGESSLCIKWIIISLTV